MRYLLAVGCSLLVLLLTGCATQAGGENVSAAGQKKQHPSEERAVARWKAMIAKDLDSAYAFLSPGSKASNPLDLYKARIRALDWRGAEALGAECEGDTCKVSIRLTLNHSRVGGEVSTVLQETWIRDSGQWWYVFK